MDLRFVLFLIYATNTFCNGAKILALATHWYASHIDSMLPFLRILADAGHSVTILETNDKKYARDFGHGIKTEHIYVPPDPRKTEDSTEIIWRSSRSGFYIAQVYNSVGDKALKMMMAYDPRTFWRIVNGTWDLLVVDELFAVHGYGIASIHKRLNGTPYIVFSTTVMLNSDSMTNALGRCWVCRVHMFISSVDELIYKPTYFTHRLANFYQHFTEYIGLRYFVQPFGMLHLRDLGITDFTWHQYFRGASAFLSDQIDNIGFPVPEGTEINNVGAICSETNTTLDTALEAFISDPKSKGTIYVAFGTYVRWKKAPEHVRKAFFSTFAELDDYRVIFVYDGPKEGIPSNVFTMDFAPQKEILNDKRTKVFISHGGLKSIKEAICADVPVVCMPIFAEQAHNVIFANGLHIGESINKMTVTKDKMLSALRRVLDDNSYHENVRRVKRLYLDKIISAKEQALFIARRVLKHSNHEIVFKRKGIDLSWTQFVYFDFLFVPLCFVVILLK